MDRWRKSSTCLRVREEADALFAAGAATQKYMAAIADEQEVMGAIADMIIQVFVMESA